MANRYWVGGTGNWNDTAHWAAISGGSGGQTVPTSADSVFFDANSFSGAGQTVTVNAVATCLDMDWTGATNNPTLGGSSSLTVSGNLTLVAGMTFNKTSTLNFNGAGKTIRSNSVTVIVGSGITISSAGSISLLDDLNILNDTFDVQGSLDTGGFNIIGATGSTFQSSNSNVRTINLRNSTITVGAWNTSTTSNLTFNAGASKIVMTNNSATFNGGGLTYNDLELQGNGPTIAGSNTFNRIIFTAGKVVKFTQGLTQTVSSLSGDGVNVSSYILLESTVHGQQYTISKASGTTSINYACIRDCIVTGGASFKATNSVNLANNTGWQIDGPRRPLRIPNKRM